MPHLDDQVSFLLTCGQLKGMTCQDRPTTAAVTKQP
ncbi:hypothetical protein SAMN00790413_02649 [Deinococcus hopiensis KR-140]|uniref:Uncharacterized protein n=1 Tax=Deinococcus hopiensis KR-140 TaxID=695939 RepID=A0A1W1VNV7_9DEIO|nr:hypothetical protein SAMN00790413_02649 [Deinococcus hopiensis KR-140]